VYEKFYLAKTWYCEQNMSIFNVFWRLWIRNGSIKIVHNGRFSALYQQKQSKLLLAKFKRNGNRLVIKMPHSWNILSHLFDNSVTIMHRFDVAFKLRPTGNKHFLRTATLPVNIKTFLNWWNIWLHRTCFYRRIFESNQALASSLTITY